MPDGGVLPRARCDALAYRCPPHASLIHQETSVAIIAPRRVLLVVHRRTRRSRRIRVLELRLHAERGLGDAGTRQRAWLAFRPALRLLQPVGTAQRQRQRRPRRDRTAERIGGAADHGQPQHHVGLEYSPDANWGVSLLLPYFDRFHTTIGEGDTDVSSSQSNGIGDLRVIARYAGFSPDHGTGIQFGLKLPTGRTDDRFREGPLAGEIVDRGLQPGTGSTDLLLGAYHFGALAQDWDYFAQALLQQPLTSKDDFRPGTGVNLSLGTRYVANAFFVPQLQLNVRAEKRESGANADIANSGATLAYLSPGVTLNFSRRFAGFVFVQAPVWQRVNGLQIEPRYSISAGLHYIF